MKTKTVKPVNGKTASGNQENGKSQQTNISVKTAAVKKEVKPTSTIERILNDLEVLNSRKENRISLLETQRKLKAFNPTVTESGCELIIKDGNGNHFRTTHTEPIKMVVGNYINIVDRKINEVEGDISAMAQKLAA